MNKYSVSIPWHCSIIIEVEAKNKKAALESAVENAYPSLCCQCSGDIQMCEMNDDCEPDVQKIEE